MRALRVSDPWLLGTTVVLLGMGVVMVYSASAVVGLERFGDPSHFGKRQLLFGTLGLLGALALMGTDYHRWRPLAYPLFALTLAALGAVLWPGVGKEVGGARRWLSWGPLSAQPAELAKLSLVLFLARFLSGKGEKAFRSHFLPAALAVGALTLPVLLQPDIGTGLLMGAVAFVLLYVGGVRPLHLWGTAGVLFPAVFGFVLSAGYRRQRLLAFLDPWGESQGTGFQLVQSYLSLGQGGWTGAGLGQGKAKLLFLPEPHTDFIFSVVGEELGFLGALGLLFLFGLLILRGGLAALRCQDPFGSLLAAGLTSLLGLQTLFHLGVVVGLLPTKGLPLPFISTGGSALFVTLVSVGLLLSVAGRNRERTQGERSRYEGPSPSRLLHGEQRVFP